MSRFWPRRSKRKYSASTTTKNAANCSELNVTTSASGPGPRCELCFPRRRRSCRDVQDPVGRPPGGEAVRGRQVPRLEHLGQPVDAELGGGGEPGCHEPPPKRGVVGETAHRGG